MANTLFIIDDDEDIRFSLSIWFKKMGYDVKTFSNLQELLQGYEKEIPNLILLDVNLNGEDGRQICKYLKSELSLAALVLLFSANPANGEDYKQYEASDFISKPFSLTEISNVIASHINS